MLMVDLGGRPSFALARYSPGETQQLRLCPAFPYTPVPVGR
jgi:hypothetical protein